MPNLCTVESSPTREQIEAFRSEQHIPDDGKLEPWAIENNMVLKYLCDLALGRDAGWIPMKERQPADFERVLCVNGAGYMTTANRFHDTKLDCWNGSDYTAEEQQELVIGGITHWMELPDMPLPQEGKG